jgi:hypothetical protein
MVCPVLVGAGKRFFENGTMTTLKQVGIEQFRAGSLHSPTSRPHRDKSNRAVRRGPPAEESVTHDGGAARGWQLRPKFSDPSLLCNREAVG